MPTAHGSITKRDNDFIIRFRLNDNSWCCLSINVATSDQSIPGSNATLAYDNYGQLNGIHKWSGFIDEKEVWIELGRGVYIDVPGQFETAGSLPALISGTAEWGALERLYGSSGTIISKKYSRSAGTE